MLAAVLLMAGTAAGQSAPARTAEKKTTENRNKSVVSRQLTEEQRRKNVESFDVAWKTIGDNHYDPKLGGVDWQKVRDELRPPVEKANGMDAAREVMQEMLDRLGHSHVAIVPASGLCR